LGGSPITQQKILVRGAPKKWARGGVDNKSSMKKIHATRRGEGEQVLGEKKKKKSTKIRRRKGTRFCSFGTNCKV